MNQNTVRNPVGCPLPFAIAGYINDRDCREKFSCSAGNFPTSAARTEVYVGNERTELFRTIVDDPDRHLARTSGYGLEATLVKYVFDHYGDEALIIDDQNKKVFQGELAVRYCR